jgi:menaquinone-dependent protoporphyrinogen oxidase
MRTSGKTVTRTERKPNKENEQMQKNVLVAYGTKYGATAEIAERIGEVLAGTGLDCDVRSADNVSDLSAYSAVVLGSGVYIGRWRKEAVRFLKAHEAELAQRPVWWFSSGPTGEGDPEELLQGWRFPGNLQPIIDRIKPLDIAVFHGALDVSKLNLLEKWVLNRIKTPVGDFRDWDAISAWAAEIGRTLQGTGSN